MHKVSVCVTVLNEATTIELLLDALASQTLQPNEVIIVDGGSVDTTLSLIKKWEAHQDDRIPLRSLRVVGNRSIGRNAAIVAAQNDWIAITDAGCVPHPDWLEQLVREQIRSDHQVIAGYYDALTQTPLEEAMVPYVLVMPDRVDPSSFLPATRSLLVHKSIWQKLGGFDSALSDNEDYVFARKIACITPISFAKAAKVQWLPRQNLRQFYHMLYRFARGDMQAGIVRTKVVLIYARYALAGIATVWLLQQPVILALSFITVSVGIYAVWAILKNKRYVPNGWYWLPVLQIVADAAVLCGSLAGLFRRMSHEKS